MELIEVRDLDGPNLFALRPVIKLEVRLDDEERVAPASRETTLQTLGVALAGAPLDALEAALGDLHVQAGLSVPNLGTQALDSPGQMAVYYDWTWRETALEIGRLAYDAVAHGLTNDPGPRLAGLLEADRTGDDRPLWIRDDARRIPSVGITGTNGKTTTTRMIAHIVRAAGKRAGWTSTSGVYIEGEQVLEGDYTGPAGARRVLEDPAVEVAVLETARGGILLRGLAYESNDVGVFLNVSPDHLDMQGIETVESLARVKSVVVRVTKPNGLVVLNADDPLVLVQRDNVRAPVLLTSQGRSQESIERHISNGGRAVVSDGSAILIRDARADRKLVDLADVPSTFGGAATHMIENALCAIGASLGLGFDERVIAEGLATFRSDIRSNAGRLNVFRLDGRLIVVDYAHNEQGLEVLLVFARRMVGAGQQVAAIVGTAGDRRDSQL
ncbi:MAG: Mur ligase family protein, partial [Vicinamibacterales bacterium]